MVRLNLNPYLNRVGDDGGTRWVEPYVHFGFALAMKKRGLEALPKKKPQIRKKDA